MRSAVAARAPHLSAMLDVYAEEAAFGHAWLQAHLRGLAPGARLLEVGAGLMLLASQLRREGYDVVALEPVGVGFSEFHALQALILEEAGAGGFAPTVLPLPVEELQEAQRYDLAFSLNVMEHVGSVPVALQNVVAALKPGAAYAFFCPNYRFPYEPHFGIPIVGSKRMTERLFHKAIHGSSRVPDPEGLWRSLNWITVGLIDRVCRQLPSVDWRYDRSAVTRALERVTTDPQFASRRSGWMRTLSRVLVATGAHRLASIIPAGLQPGIDCTIVRRNG